TDTVHIIRTRRQAMWPRALYRTWQLNMAPFSTFGRHFVSKASKLDQRVTRHLLFLLRLLAPLLSLSLFFSLAGPICFHHFCKRKDKCQSVICVFTSP